MAVLRLLPPSGTPIELNRDSALVGREPSCDVVLNDGSVSRRHARFEKRGDGWVVIDQGSANGTFLDSQRIGESPLRAGQELRFGAVPFRIELDAEPPDLSETLAGSDDGATLVQPALVDPPRPVVAPPPPAPAPMTPAVPLVVPPPAATPRAPTAPSAASPTPPLPPRPATAPPPPVSRPAVRPAAPVPPMAAGAPAPPKQGRGPLFWILGGCCGCLVLVMLTIGALGGGLMYMTGDAVKTARDQMQEIKSGDMKAAYSRMSGGYQAATSQEQFESFVARHPGLKDNADSTFLHRSVQNDTARISGVLSSTSGASEPVSYELVKENGRWRIAAIQFVEELSVNGGGPVVLRSPAAAGAARSGGGSLTLDTVKVDKQPSEGGNKVSINLRASGFGLQRSGDAFMVHLVEDLETIGPDGEVINSLSKDSMQVLNDQADSDEPGTRDFLTEIELLDPPPGTYVARITIHDRVSGQSKQQDVSFDLP